jgi:L-gulonate 5-dehydrogenase
MPVPGPEAVVVKVQSVGVCAGDLHIYNGRNPYAVYPCIGGHEIAGEVEQVGADVDEWQPHDRVVVEPFLSCGKCYPCRIGKPNCCTNISILGVHMPGGFAEYVAAPASHIHRIPQELSTKWATFAEPLAIAIQACRRAELDKEDCLVVGCGPIGLALIEVARARGATVMATDINLDRLEMASKLGAKVIPMDESFAGTIADHMNGEGVPVVFEATGAPEVISQCFDLVASGGRLVTLGLIPKGVSVSLPGLDLTRKEATILGSRASAYCFPEALELLASGHITYPAVATEIPMWEGPNLLKTLSDSQSAMHKAVLTL